MFCQQDRALAKCDILLYMLAIYIYVIVHHILLSVGLASSIVIDIFIIMVEKTKKIRGIERNIMSRVMSYSFITSLFVFGIQLLYFLAVYMNQTLFTLSAYFFAAFAFLISSLLVFCTATQKYYQFKILERYQEQHAHLSDSFIQHHKEFKRTSVVIFILWLILYLLYVIL